MNVQTLVKFLSQYPHTQDMYVGKPSLDRPIEATERLGDNKMVRRRFLFFGAYHIQDHTSYICRIILFFFNQLYVFLCPYRNQSTSGLLLEEQGSV